MKKTCFLFFVLSTFLNFSQEEILINGGLEIWGDHSPLNWDKYEHISQESGIVHSGTFSAKVEAAGTSDLTQNLLIIPGESYTISFWYYVESGDGTDARIWSYWLNGLSTVMDATTDDALHGPNNSYLPSNASWQQYMTTVTAPSFGVNGLRFEVRTYGSAVVYWDDLSVIDNNTLTIKNTQKHKFSIFPNPTSLGYFNISSNNNTKIDVLIFDMLGNQIINTEIAQNTLNVSSLKAGVYLAQIHQNGATITKKLVTK
ncbi:T9SS type A sorting domain-containing protein [Tamlana fucoidanivorans]|uniref:T9SS type A sorting domain-containing protein n=1 Tax=Allotamlana fucoidanivorans TaxID=2583814 RepID=A0A5C4SK87_9FLAO|nr:T9SS type A sorting domain-containing protein [Tamlana fucoidanivorans]TNJ44239.1 T9SS type A sorting domain-containing protein [Tamlana fucoidanivorans]